MAIKAKIKPLCNGRFAVLVKFHWWQRYKPIYHEMDLAPLCGSVKILTEFTLEEAQARILHLTRNYDYIPALQPPRPKTK